MSDTKLPVNTQSHDAENALSLLDVLLPAARGAEPHRHQRVTLPLDATEARLLFVRASAEKWLADTPFAAAWIVTVDQILGQASIKLTEQAPAEVGARVIASTHVVSADCSTGEFLRRVDAARREASQESRSAAAAAAEHLWRGLAPALGESISQESPIAVGLQAAENTAQLFMDFSEARLDATTARSLLRCMQRVLSGFSNATAALQSIDVIGADERAVLFTKWNTPPRQYDAKQNVDRVFAAQAEASPNAIALAWHGGTMTYGALLAQSIAIAGLLREAGVAPGAVVGVALDRSAAAIATLLAILRVGAAYLPIDLKYPRERIDFMLSDANVDVVVAFPEARSMLPTRVTTLDVSTPTVHAAASGGENAASETSGASVAYVMYTSGSTGQPKGIEICHHAILRLVRDVEFVDLSKEQVLLHAAPLGFDASTLEIWGALLNGGKCVLHDETVPTGPGLARSISAHGVTTAWLTAALFNAVVDDNPSHLKGLTQLLAGGEALSVPHVMRAMAALPQTTLINGYGPTECTTFTATYRIPRDFDPQSRSVPIGRPISETSVYVLNRRLQPVPIGVVGELCVGGLGLARRYLGNPQLNAEKFVPNPFGAPGERLYRTGDLVRYLPDGNIEFVGRVDGQVKIRGFRIEVGEIETIIGQQPRVRACAVVARKDQPGGARLIGYVVPDDAAFSVAALRAELLAHLPDFMVPSTFVLLDQLPVTANGKLDRRALPVPENRRPALATEFVDAASDTERLVAAVFQSLLGLDCVGVRDNFFELGGNSLLVVQAVAQLSKQSGRAISVTAFFSDPTPRAIAQLLESGATGVDAKRLSRADRTAVGRAMDHSEPIAIIAMTGRFPGASSVETFWDNLIAGRDTITFWKDEELDNAVPAQLRSDPAYVKGRGVIDGVEMFDAVFFGISPREAELMDPQQRIFMELCWECLERGGYVPDAVSGPVGVFGGMYNATYFQRHVSGYPEKVNQLGEFQVMLANEKDYITTRTANRLNLTGPAVSVHTACSTSLVAIAQAVLSLRSRQCDMALAGGASVTCPPRSGYLYQEGAMLSPDGHTRTFDANAQGTVFSDGAAVVLLKRLSDALADGDSIQAVIRGVAVNNDGGAKASFTAPSVDGQAAVIAAALDDAGVRADSIDYVEAHGTATPLGDPVEIEALTKAFRRHTDDRAFCRIGSVKSNVGHLVIAAGATGVIKTALSLAHETIPATLHFEAPNPKLELGVSPFTVNAKQSAWKRRSPGESPRRAGVSAFGVGGTNAHVVLEEAPLRAPSAVANGPQLLVLSARTPAALAAQSEQLALWLEQNPTANLSDVAHTLRVGRKGFVERLCVVGATSSELAQALREQNSAARASARALGKTPRVVFMFPGQGAQYGAMGKALYEAEPVFREAFDACLDGIREVLAADLKQVLFSGDAEALTQTEFTQPAIFAIEYALARYWMSLGIAPSLLMGHSIGEFVAATIAGVFEVKDAARLVARRGQLMQALPTGAMLAVRAGAESVLPKLPANLSMAAANSPKLCVVAGPHEDVETFRAALEAEGIVAKLLQTSHAFHSAMMDAVVQPFFAEVSRLRLSAPSHPIMSTVTGALLTNDEAQSPRYWAQHLRATVQFSPALLSALETKPDVLLEIGPRATLSTLAQQHAAPGRVVCKAIASVGDSADQERSALALGTGRLWTLGAEIGPEQLDSRTDKRRVLLPTYPFERQRFWLEAKSTVPVPSVPAAATEAPALPHPSIPISFVVSSSVTEPPMSTSANSSASPGASSHRVAELSAQLRTLLEDISGVDMAGANPSSAFVELGLDSLSLTQIAIQLKQTFKVNVTFRQLMEKYRTLDALAAFIDGEMPAAPAAAPAPAAVASPVAQPVMPQPATAIAMSAAMPAASSMVQQVIQQQMQLMAQQLALLQGAPQAMPQFQAPAAASAPEPVAQTATAPTSAPAPAASADESAGPMKYDVKKAFGAIARIHTENTGELTERQRARLDAFMRRYMARTRLSKEYTVKHRPHLADPRVVNGFRPMLKEIIYQIVISQSKGSHMWDLDGNEYVDVLNGFGMNMFGWQPAFINDAVKRQLDEGYDIGPQHPLAGEVARLICDVTGHDRVGLCNTGSEAVMGAVRIARTVTGRNTIAIFTGSYHGIFDEVIVRATKKLRAVPAAPGIMPSTAQNVIVLDYGTPESMEILKSRMDELAAVLVEPVQSRRPDFQPREFLRELREVTKKAGTLLIFDEVVTGFRCHPGGIKALFGIDADLCTYGKVVGGGFPIGVIAGKREYMDALDGGAWQYGDDSIPTVGVTYFAGTFVRHPLALAAAKAVLEHLKREGPALQAALTLTTTAMIDELNAFCRERGAPIVLKSFASVWKTFFTEDHPLQDLLFAMMRSRGVHILDNFPCFFTTAHTTEDIAIIKTAFKESVIELQESGFIPAHKDTSALTFDATKPPMPGARIGKDPEGNPAWFVPNPDSPGKYLRLDA